MAPTPWRVQLILFLKKGFNGFSTDGTYGHANGTDATTGNLSWGYNGEHGGIGLIASYQSRSELTGSDRNQVPASTL